MKLVLTIISTLSLITSSQSSYPQVLTEPIAQVSEQNSISLPEPPPRGIPRQRQPAGTRGPCDASAHTMTPLLPVSSATEDNFSGATQKSHPAFWFYIPDEAGSAIQGRFSLEDSNGNLVYRTDLTFPTTPGLAGINIPETAPALQADQSYRWYFKIHCTEEGTPQENFLFHTGLVTYLDNPSLVQQLSMASPTERLAIYDKYSLWYDVVIDSDVDTLNTLLSAIGLEDLSDTPTIEPISVNP